MRVELVGDVGGGACFGRGLWGTATDVSSAGETRRGREGESWDVSLRLEVVRVWVRDVVTIFEGLRELGFREEGGSSDNRASAAVHASMSQSDVALGSRSGPRINSGMWVTKAMGAGPTGGG